jgi:beta-mannosidase
VRTELHDGWSVAASGGDGLARLGAGVIPAAVPGCVHLDLLASGLIPDPYLGENEADVAWVGRTDWTYSTTFHHVAEGSERTDLVLDGLDTVAIVKLNGVVVARTRNMHRSFRVDVSDGLREGDNVLDIVFSAPITEAEAAADRLGARPHVNRHPYNALRKNASSFGWDWGPDLPSSGIWRPIALEAWRTARIASVRPLAGVAADGSGILDLEVEVEVAGAAGVELSVSARVAGRSTVATLHSDEAHASLRVVVPDVDAWWPRGYGNQPLYDVAVELFDGESRLDGRTQRVGFRTVAVATNPDEAGTSFELLVNGRTVLVRGYNWIPDDAFPSSVGRSRVESSIRQAFDSHANLLRVWGGGIYESDDFYDVCDELGILVWQDFLFACAAYPEEPELRDEVEAEAREAVVRLSAHPSLALWCGGNECLWGHEDWDWKEPLAGASWGLGYYSSLLPSLVAELDPSRPYIPGSPYSPTPGKHPNDPAHGPMHIWDVWNSRDYTAYLEYEPRFVSEFGFQGPPTWSTLTRALDEASLHRDSSAWLAHQKAEDGDGKLDRGMSGHLSHQDSFEDWHWATSLNQARAVAAGVEHFRSLAPHCAGAVVWQLNDCWPVTSWSAVDGDGRRKPLWYALRRSFSDRILVLEPLDGAVVLGVVNDSAEPWTPSVRVSRVAYDGRTLVTETLTVEVPARCASRVVLPASLALAGEPDQEVLLAEVGPLRSVRPFVEDVDSRLEPPSLDVRAVPVDGGWEVTVTTDVLVRDLSLLVDRLDPSAVVDDMLVTLLPGETATFFVSLPEGVELEEADFADPRVLRSANDLRASVAARLPAG